MPFPSPTPRDRFAAPLVSAGEDRNLLSAEGRAIYLERETDRAITFMLRDAPAVNHAPVPNRAPPGSAGRVPYGIDGSHFGHALAPGTGTPRPPRSACRHQPRQAGARWRCRDTIPSVLFDLPDPVVRRDRAFLSGTICGSDEPGSCEPDRLGDPLRWDGHGPDGAGPPEPGPGRDQRGRSDAIREHGAPAPEGRKLQLHTDPSHSPRTRRRTEF